MFFSGKKLRNLAESKGPYVPGCIDVMLEYSQSGIFARLYYPTNEKHNEVNPSKWIPWVPDENYFLGIGKALLFLSIICRFTYWLISDVLTPVLYGAKVNKHKKLPCIIMSHGYAGNRLYYSIICNELASRGYLIAVIEHRDESAGYTYFYKNKEDAAADIKTPLHPRIIPFDDNFYSERNRQAHYRANECSKLLDFLIDLNNGKIPHNVLKDLKNEKDVDFDWGDFAGLLDLSTLTMCGHSFGGGTTLYAMSIRKEFKQGILMDPWMFPVKHEENIVKNVTQPLIFINSETFHIPASVKDMAKYLAKNNKTNMYTILHTSHEIQSDTGCLFGFWMNTFKKKLAPYQAADINNGLILRFLKTYTGNTESIEDYELCLKKEEENVIQGLTTPWTRALYIL